MTQRFHLTEGGCVFVDNMAIPLVANEEYCTPEIQDALMYWKQYAAYCERKGIEPLSPLRYVLTLCRALAASTAPGSCAGGCGGNCEPEWEKRGAKDFFHRIMDHFGRQWFIDQGLMRDEVVPIPSTLQPGTGYQEFMDKAWAELFKRPADQ